MGQLLIKTTKYKGRGVFAGKKINKGSLIEICEILVVNFHEIGPFLERYVFEYSKNKIALALGNGSLYNHHESPNARCELDTKRKKLFFYSVRDIKKGEEITIDYGYTEADKKRFGLS